MFITNLRFLHYFYPGTSEFNVGTGPGMHGCSYTTGGVYKCGRWIFQHKCNPLNALTYYIRTRLGDEVLREVEDFNHIFLAQQPRHSEDLWRFTKSILTIEVSQQ